MLSADGSTVYVNGRDQRLWALHAADGKPKWSVPLGFLAQTPPAVTPQGLIVSGGGPDTRLAAFRDAGDHAEQIWRRDDVTPLSTSSLAGTGVGYTVASGPPKDGAPGMSLLVFDPTNGHTINSYPIAGGHRISRRGVDSQRPPGGDRHQRRPGLRFRAGVTTHNCFVPSRASDIAVTIVLLMVHAFLWAATVALLGLLVMGTDSRGYQRCGDPA